MRLRAIPLAVVIGVSMSFANKQAKTPAIPFGAGTHLTYGIKPSATQEKLNQELTEFYYKWKGSTSGIEDVPTVKGYGDGYLARYYSEGTEKPVYIVKGNVTGSEPEPWKKDSVTAVSCSEATGYGMIIFALMAGQESNAQKYFDGLMNLYLRNKSNYSPNGKELHTMSWVLPSALKVNGEQPERSGSAADGDLDIAYALLLAHKQWGTPSIYADTKSSYLDIALPLIKDIHDYLISDKSFRILMGDSFSESTGGSSSKTYKGRYNASATRPSDWMISHLRVFNEYYPSPKWDKAIKETYRVLRAVAHPKTGLVPDFVEDIKGKPVPALKTIPIDKWYQDSTGEWKAKKDFCFLEGAWDDKYGSNACRVPWRLALDYGHYGTAGAQRELKKMADFTLKLTPRRVREDWDNEDWYARDSGFSMSSFPLSIYHGYELDGAPIGSKEDPKNWDLDRAYVSMPFIAPLAFTHLVRKDGATEVDKAWEFVVGNFGGDHSEDEGYTCYFGDSVALLTLLMISGNWWIPHKE